MLHIDRHVLDSIADGAWASLHEVRARLAPVMVVSRLEFPAALARMIRAGLIEERGGAAGAGRSGRGAYAPEQYQIRRRGGAA